MPRSGKPFRSKRQIRFARLVLGTGYRYEKCTCHRRPPGRQYRKALSQSGSELTIFTAHAGMLPGQPLSRRRADGPASGPRRSGARCAGAVGLAGRRRGVSHRRRHAGADPSKASRLSSGDVIVFGGAARLAYHGIDRDLAGTRPWFQAAGASISRCAASARHKK